MNFLGYYEKRLKLQLLQAELESIVADGKALVIVAEKAGQEVSTASFRIEVMETILVDSFSILADQANLLKALNSIRTTARHVNNELALFYPSFHLPLSNKTQVNQQHNEWLRSNVPALLKSAEQAQAELKRFLATS